MSSVNDRAIANNWRMPVVLSTGRRERGLLVERFNLGCHALVAVPRGQPDFGTGLQIFSPAGGTVTRDLGIRSHCV